MTPLGTFLEALAPLGYPTAERVVLDGCGREGTGPLRVLLRLGVPLSALRSAAWAVQGFPSCDLRPDDVPTDVLGALPIDLCRRARAIAVGRHGDEVTVAIADPSDVGATDEIRRSLEPDAARFTVAEPAVIDELVRRYQANTILGPPADAGEAADPHVTTHLTETSAGDSQAARTVASIIDYAVGAGASDVHLVADESGAAVRIRLDGVLHPYCRIAGGAAVAAVVGRIKVLGGLDLGNRRVPQDGRIRGEAGGRAIDIRVATLPSVWDAEDVALRILDPAVGVEDLQSLGMSPAATADWSRLWSAPYGLVLVTGPTGSGKSTTLYATLRQVATPERAVRTVEDPVEVRMPGITQVQANPRAGVTFERALRAFLRSDPDVILVGEVRDQETARVVADAAVTGHLVLATLHTPSAPHVPVRLTEMGIPPHLVAASLLGASSQRLVRRLCPDCRVLRPPGQGAAWPLDGGEPPEVVAEAALNGCGRCSHTGYRGRMAVSEVMVVGDELREAVAARAPTATITRLAVAAGMVPLRAAVLDAVRSGVTSLSELTRATAGESR